MKQKKFDQLVLVVSQIDDLVSLVSALQDKRINGAKGKKIRLSHLSVIRQDLAVLKSEILKI